LADPACKWIAYSYKYTFITYCMPKTWQLTCYQCYPAPNPDSRCYGTTCD
jgi:hypothetical protein